MADAKNMQVATQSNGAVAQKQSFSQQLTQSLMGVKEALPKDFNMPRFVQNAVALLNDNKNLAEYANKNGTAQIMLGLHKGAFLGLDFFNQECHLIPYGNDLNFQKDYRGARKLVKKYSIKPVDDVYAMLIREGDVLEEMVVMGKRGVNFKPISLNDGAIKGAFAVVLYKDGTMAYDTMTFAELENTRKHSKASNSMAWKDFPGEMYKKTVLHRLAKQIDLEFENPKQKELFMADMEIETDTAKIVEMEIAENANTVEFTEVAGEPEQTATEQKNDGGDLPDFMTTE